MQYVQPIAVAALAFGLLVAHPLRAAAGDQTVESNDNTRAAGTVDGDTVTITLRAGRGAWRPEGPHGPALSVEAFAEEGAALSIPAPLIRVREGATLAVSIHNDLPAPLRVHGLCTRDGSPCAPLDVPAGERRELRFAAGRAGTYHYWATTMQAPVPFRELAGALVIDPASEPPPADRIFVITEWTSLSIDQLRRIIGADVAAEAFLAEHPRITFVINGRSWPATERLTYRRGDTVRWRVINLSSQSHPMHLHGFYFTVLRTGDGRRDNPVAGGEGRRVVTQLLPAAGTMLLEWTPERAGNWLFHCHVMHHVSPERRLDAGLPVRPGDASETSHPHDHDEPSLGMAGMVLGITVLDANPASSTPSPAPAPRRRLTMAIRGIPGMSGGPNAASVQIVDDGSARPEAPPISPGPLLVLRRGEPVEIAVINQMTVGTSIHWHGLEIDSYYDGVHGWSGSEPHLAPMIEPGATFVVRIAPTRAGTFIYHTHFHDYQQLSSGLYGAIVVTEPKEAFDPAVDHIVVLGRRDASEASGILEDASSLVVNGEREPRWVWGVGRRHRLRLINITPDDLLTVSVVARTVPVTWRPLTKDGVQVPEDEGLPGPAEVRIGVGETYDFEYEARPGNATLWLEVRGASGKWLAQGRVIVK
jgi:FtsP/CotA-like multicopper oxidase with cupredoxin domain